MSPSDFRITTTAVTIDTTDTSSWIVYDHYRDQSTYDAMKLDASLQPYRAADNTKTDGNGKISDYFANGGSTVNDQDYTSTATKYDTFMKPSHTSYTFEGWFQKNADGSMGTTEYKGGENLIVKANHSFVAKWAPKNDTKYTVDYYINYGEVDKNGEFIYTKVPGVSKTYSDTTETQVQVKEGDKLSTIEVDGVQYWFNADSANNVLKGKVSGSPAPSLKLCYDRYFTVNASTNGTGTAQVVKKDEGTAAMRGRRILRLKTLAFEPETTETPATIVNAPALMTAVGNKTTNITDNHVIEVYFTKDDEKTEDDGTPDINIDKDNDGLPDVDVDTDDDGEPDVNIDTDGDGEPDVNIDTDGDLVPDANIDTNGDLIPDVNIINRGSHVISDPNIVTIGAVQTGDVDLSLMILVMLASAMGLAAVLRKRLGMSK